METTTLSFKEHALTKVMGILKQKFPVAQYCYFETIKYFNSRSQELHREISHNFINLSAKKRTAYAHHLLEELSSVSFHYDPDLIELKLRKYNETYASFPYFVDPVLRSKLQYQISEVKYQDVNTGKDLAEFVTIKDLQSSFLQLALEMEVNKIIGYVRRKFDLDASENKKGKKEHSIDLFNGKKAYRYYEKTLFSSFQEQFSPQNDQERLLTPLHLEQKLSAQLKTIHNLAKGLLDEIKDNLIAIPVQNCFLYLKWLKDELISLQYSLNDLHEVYLQADPSNFECPQLQLHFQHRPDLHAALSQIVGLKLQKVDSLLELVIARLTENMEASARKKTDFSIRILVNIFSVMGIFKVKLMSSASNVEKANFVAGLFNLNKKNIKSEIEKLGLKSSQTNAQYKADVIRAEEFVKSIFKNYP